LSRSKKNETSQPSTKNLTDKTKTVDTQHTKTKTAKTKATQTNRTEKRNTEIPSREVKRAIGSFNLESEINKIKIPVPLVELAKNPMYKKQIAKMINFSNTESHADSINLEDDNPTIMFGLHIKNAKDPVAPFYITLTVHDHLLHNYVLDYGSSHNLMPKAIMEKLGLKVTRPY
jgi:hypothetical protein